MAVKERKVKPGERFLGGSGVILIRKPRKPSPLEETVKEIERELLEAEAEGRINHNIDDYLKHIGKRKH